ncbi:hypothetical protein ACFL1E_05300 [Candidatus Omnitrophota bacterium]
MKKSICLVVLLALVATGSLVYAQEKDLKGASPKAYEHASDQAVFNRVSDWFATVGKSKEEKVRIRAERKAKRAAEKMKKKANRAAEELDTQSKEKAKKLKKQEKKAKGLSGGRKGPQ